MARKRPNLSPDDYREIRRIAKAEALRITRESTSTVRALGSLSPITRPFVAPVAAGINRSAKLLLDSGALDGYIDQQIAQLMRERNVIIETPPRKSRQEIVFDLAEAGIDILTDPMIQEELRNLDDAVSDSIGLDTIRSSGQFSRQNLLPRFAPGNSKRARKKTKTDKDMSKALAEANSRLRTKKGKLRKGKSQADVMKLAHRLRKKMR